MKQIVLLILTFLLFFGGSWYVRKKFFQVRKSEKIAQSPQKKLPVTKFKVKEEIIDLGKIYRLDTVIRCDFVLYNLGPENLYIVDVKPDCKCIGYSRADKSEPVAPGDSTVVTLEYRPKQSGTFQVTASVEANAEENAFLVLRGEVANIPGS